MINTKLVSKYRGMLSSDLMSKQGVGKEEDCCKTLALLRSIKYNGTLDLFWNKSGLVVCRKNKPYFEQKFTLVPRTLLKTKFVIAQAFFSKIKCLVLS